jgi:RND superfamily putative drug exporter
MILRLTGLIAQRAWAVVIVAVFILAGAGAYGGNVFESLSNGGFDDPDSESARELALEQETFGNHAPDVIAIFSSADRPAASAGFRAEVEGAIANIDDGVVTAALTYYDTSNPDQLSSDGHATAVYLSLAGAGQNDKAVSWAAVRDSLASDSLDLHLAGAWPTYGDVNKITKEDLGRAEAISAPLVLLLSLLIFGSVVAALMPVMVGLVTVLGSLAVLKVFTEFTEVSIFSVNIVSLIGMGMAIDYALFIISRFREELAKLPADDPDAVKHAISVTMATAGRTVLFSGLTVAASLSALLVFPVNFLRSLGYGAIAAVTIAMISALTLLPAVLRLLGRRIDAGRLPWRRRQPVSVDTEHGKWASLAHFVMRRPVLILVGVTAALLVVASPFLGVKWGSVDYRVLPDDAPAFIAAEKLNAEFGPEKSTANIMVTSADEAQLASYVADLEATDGVVGVYPIESNADHALLSVTWLGNSQTEASQAIVEDIRGVAPPEGVEVLVGGLSADTVDLIDSIAAHLPWMGVIVISVMFVLLFIAFGSVLLPLKALVMNFISITASFGVVTWIFSEGHLENVIDFTPQGFLDVTQPVFMLAILFGLSMDYEVFLLSRVREQWDKTGDNAASVAVGLQKTGRIITSAALLLAIVIGAFSLSGIVFMKLIGIGQLVALLVDATIVRALLVPAAMKLMGSLNWWAPGPMRSWYDRHGFKETDDPALPPTPVLADH